MDYDFHEEYREISKKQEELLSDVPYYLAYAMCFFGAPTNLITFIILFRPKMRSSVNCCLQILAAFDTLFVLSDVFVINDVAPEYFHMLFYIALTGSTWTFVLLTLMRFVDVFPTLKARNLFTYGRTILCGLLITVCAICINIPRQFLIGSPFPPLGLYMDGMAYVDTRYGHPEGVTINIREINVIKIYGWFEIAVIFCIPLVLSGFFGIYTYIAAKKSTRESQEMTPAQMSEVKLSKTIVVIFIVFFICCIPTVICKSSSYTGTLRMSPYLNLGAFMIPLLQLRSVANFALYCVKRRSQAQSFRNLKKNSFANVNTIETTSM